MNRSYLASPEGPITLLNPTCHRAGQRRKGPFLVLVTLLAGCSYPCGERSDVRERFKRDFAPQIAFLTNHNGVTDPASQKQASRLFESEDILSAAIEYPTNVTAEFKSLGGRTRDRKWFYGNLTAGEFEDAGGMKGQYCGYRGDNVKSGAPFELQVAREYFRRLSK